MICQVCSQTLPYSGNTTNLTYHLKQSCNEEYVLISKSAPSPSTPKPKKKEQTQMDYFTKVSTLEVANIISNVRSW